MSDVNGKGVVVTGGGRGIGRAIATRLAAEGAHVVVNDVDARAAREVASVIGARAIAGDSASVAGTRKLVDSATSELGRIDIYFANAGIETGGGIDTTEETWLRAHEVNVMAHVRAARLLVPTWLAGGGGRFVVTASAAGLLSMLGDAPYSVTKHAAVAFAEWLSITYGDRGIIVQTLCPQGVHTRMLEQAGAMRETLSQQALLPEQVADVVWEALGDDRFLILPHREVSDYYVNRASDTQRWLGGMRKLQHRLDDE